MTYVETPRTDAGNATYLTNGHNLEDFSVENSFLSPLKHKDDLISQLRNGRGISLKTPRGRGPLADLRNLPAGPVQGEFTPLLHSGIKKDLLRNGKLNGLPQTPAFLKPGYKGGKSPALPLAEASVIYGDDTGSVVEGDDDGTPIPHVTSSSAQSTPMPVLPRRDAGGVLQDQGNLMTLREQENIINKIEKENFGLKLKIHFLEESLRKAGPGFNEAALRENTDLKVDKITMQKELARARKTLNQAERDLETYRLHLQDVQQEMKRKHADKGLHEELESLGTRVASKESEVEVLRQKLGSAEGNLEELERYKGEVEDLESDLREKDRLIEERDDEVDRLKTQAIQDAQEIEELEEHQGAYAEQATKQKESEEELQAIRSKLQNLEDDMQVAKSAANDAKEEAREASDARQKAEDDLNELRDELSNKSINTRGLSRQLEEKANKLEIDLTKLREEHTALEERFEDKSREAIRAQEGAIEIQQDAEVQEQRLKDDNELLRHEREVITRKCESLKAQVSQMVKEGQVKADAKDLLHSRHDALTAESQNLQRDLSEAQTQIQELERNLQGERQHSLDNDRQLRTEVKDEINRCSEEIDSLHGKLKDRESQYEVDQDHLESQKRDLESRKIKAEERAAGLQRTVDMLQKTEGTLSGRETKLQEALESEKQRHHREEAVLDRQIKELSVNISEKRHALEDLRSEVSGTKEELRVSKRDQTALEEKIEALEDEVEVLQSGLDEEVERATDEVASARQEAESLRRQLQNFQTDLEADHGSKEQMSSRLRDVEAQLQQVKAERQSLQDRLATIKIEMHTLQTTSAEIEAERDELRSQMKQMQNQVDETFRLDQEKLELRASTLKLDGDLHRLRDERKGLIERNVAIERDLEEEVAKTASVEARLGEEVAKLESKLAVASGGRDRELSAARQKAQRLDAQIKDLETRLSRGEQDGEVAAELSMIQKDLSTARRKETESLQREALHKESIRDLKQKLASLERQVHEIEVSRLVVDSPRSSVGGSARKNELTDIRRQLGEAHQQIKDVRARTKESEKHTQGKRMEAEREAQSNYDSYEQQREQLEQQLSACRLQQEEQATKNITAEKTITRLRTRIQSLEQSLHVNRASANGDRTMADERKDLHEMLKDAKLEAEDLQLQISDRQSRLDAAAFREKDLRAQLRRVRGERTLQSQKSAALNTELETLQSRYERNLDNLAHKQQSWEEERKAIVSRVRFPNMSISSIHPGESSTELKHLELVVQEKEKRHQGELKGLAKQIQWIRARFMREEGFRKGLAYEKRFLLMQIEMFNACNTLDLHLLSEVGVTPDRRPSAPRKRPTIRTVSLMIIAGVRMKRFQREWAVQKKVQAQLAKKLDGVRRQSVLKGGGRELEWK